MDEMLVETFPRHKRHFLIAYPFEGRLAHTTLAMLVGEELDCDWSRIRVEAAPVEPRYYDPVMREYRTDGSTSVMSSWEPFRQAGALARHLLVAAAAKSWGVDAESLRTEGGRVVHDPTGRSASYGELAPLAATVPTPTIEPAISWNTTRSR